MPTSIFFFLVFISFCTYAVSESMDATSLSMVPHGKLVEKDGRKYKIKTQAGTRIWVEFFRNGKLEEASGKNLNKGDDFEPGQGLISLATAAEAAAIPGSKLHKKWGIDQDEKYGWVYEFEGDHKGIEREILVNARSGKIISSDDIL